MTRRSPSPRSGSFGGPAGADPVVMSPAIARSIAVHLHLGQTDKAGQPYHLHVTAVGDMVAMLGGTDEEIIAGYFHDAVEDEKTTIEALADMGVSEHSLGIIWAVTKIPGEPNDSSLMRVLAHGRSACLVKFADLLHNTREDRFRALLASGADPDKAYRRLRVYRHWLKAIMVELGLLGPEVGQ